MRVLFINFNVGATAGINNGLAVLSSVLKKEGHKAELIFICEELDYGFDLARIKEDILKFKPDIIGISLMEPQFKYMKIFCEDLRNYYDKFVVCGGPHPSMDPEAVLAVRGVDAVCIGEGEDAICELAKALEDNKGYSNIKNLWFKEQGGRVVMNRLRPFKNLDELPEDDKEIFDLNKLISLKNNQLEMSMGRGCVYKCSYCINDSYMAQYKKLSDAPVVIKDYVRMKRPKAVINEIKGIISRYSQIEKIAFIDDNFLMYDDFVADFCDRYKREIPLPFMCNANPLSFSRKKAKILKGAGCDDVRFGIESGSDRIKREIMNRPMANKNIIKAFRVAKELELMSSSFNIIGLPTETKKEVFETLKLNAAIAPDTVKVMTFYPFKNTPIYRMCENLSLIDYDKKDSLDSYDTFTCLKFSQKYQLFLKKIQVSFNWYMNLFMDNEASPEYERWIKKIEDMPENEWNDFNFYDVDRKLSDGLKRRGVPHYAKFINRSLAVKFSNKHFD